MYPIKQSTAVTTLIYVHDENGDPVTGLVDGGFTKRISKNGGAFGAMTVTITELESGWYSVPISTAHSDTLGVLTMFFTHISSEQVNLQFRVDERLLGDLPVGVAKNAAFNDIEFLMVLASDHVTPATGLTVTGQRSIDGAAFAAVDGTIAEVGNGIYQFDALAADTNGDMIVWRFSSATADDTFVQVQTTP